MDPVEDVAILDSLAEFVRSRVAKVEVFEEIESTNSYLMQQPAPTAGTSRIAIADQQTAGRGRLEKTWQSPAGSGLYLSTSYTFDNKPDNIACLTLAIGVAVAKALRNLGVHDIKLKWPNDLIVNDGKLGGILTELQSDTNHGICVVVGIGLNINMRSKIDDSVATVGRVADLHEVLSSVPNRDALATFVIESIVDALTEFDSYGFKSFHAAWHEFDWFKDKSVSVANTSEKITGVVSGIDKDGALLVKRGDEIERVVSGVVSIENA